MLTFTKMNSRAIEIATTALTKVEEHQKYCLEKDEALRKDVQVLHAELKGLQTTLDANMSLLHGRINNRERAENKRLWTIVGPFILLLLTIIGYLLVDGRPWDRSVKVKGVEYELSVRT